MTGARFGGSAGLLQRMRPVRIGVDDLREVADAVLPGLAAAGLRIDLVQRSGAGSLVVLEEDERTVRVPLAELADEMSRAGVTPTPEGMAAALAAWVAHRPVTDVAAATSGIAVLDWADRGETAIGWRIVVRRGALALPWTPSPSADGAELDRVRRGAGRRAHEVALDLRVEGPVALWSHPRLPVLASAVLVAPERMLRRLSAAGLVMPDMHVVVTPRRPVACAGPSIAARLAGETTEASVTLPWPLVADLPWL
ncbi:hypothetical protein [Blastococcus tunisiensis]|uniref:Uncharacterized protein n=1 Tax=Blastococcus tunisiensis TaxID=1798228 RepID=A0A1I2KT14_9ACTN|nr:hypothetical protein [Blastococcus sp. DSM 46838]SFF70065.1 hypothetical protein SAMN05216574_12343 [Blastococcus sp. DSM 46838]